MQLALDDRVALVTGATGGIGETVARELGAHGATVVVNGRSEDSAEAVVEGIEASGGTADYVLADINDYDAVEGMVETVVDRHGGLDVLVASGAASSGPVPTFFDDTAPEDLASFCTSMYLNRMYCVKAALDPLADADGRVVFVSSDAGRWPTPGEIGPGTASAAVMMATKVLAAELARVGVTVNTVSVSVIDDTPAMDWVLQESPAAPVFERALEKQAFPVTASDVAETVLFLAGSEGARPITGQLLSVNDGISFPG